jgi:hypothetical protein
MAHEWRELVDEQQKEIENRSLHNQIRALCISMSEIGLASIMGRPEAYADVPR